jgi:hypothetical protein
MASGSTQVNSRAELISGVNATFVASAIFAMCALVVALLLIPGAKPGRTQPRS